MGSELSKRYDVDKDATGSGGHGYQWKSYQATRKKDGLEVSVFVFEKASLEKQLRNQKSLFEKVVLTAPGKNCPTYIVGVHEGDYASASDPVVSNASCTTNRLQAARPRGPRGATTADGSRGAEAARACPSQA